MVALTVLPAEFGICRLDSSAEIPSWIAGCSTYFLAKTPDELSVLCPVRFIPKAISVSGGWRCMRVHGPMDFDQIGVLSSLTGPLAEAGISILAISTYNTDYLLVKMEMLQKAINVLEKAGHRVTASA